MTISGTVANDKIYNGDTLATLSNIGAVTTGVGTETLVLNGPLAANINFNSKDVALATTVTGTGYSIANGVGGLASNYALTSTSSTAAAHITPTGITGSITAANKIYDANDVATITGRSLTGVLGTDVVSYSGGAASFIDKNAGTGKTVTGSGLGLTGADASNYTVNSTATTTANITPAPLGIAANSATRLYGDANPAFSATYAGFRGTDSADSLTGALALATPASPASNVGNYVITPSGQSSTNYTIAYVNGTLGVTPAPLGIAANSATRLYGDANPAFSATYTGFKNGETEAALTGALAFATPAVLTSNVGNYAITPSGRSSTNYTITYVNGRLSVTPAPLGIAANSTSKTYGDTVSFTGSEFSSTGLKNGETIGRVNLDSAGKVATAGVEDSPYDITASAASGGTFNARNYTISYVGGTLGVIPADLLGIAANSAAKTYDGQPYSGGNGVSYTGFMPGDNPANSLTGTLVYIGSSQGAVNVGNYTIIPSGLHSDNYRITYVNGRLSVTPAPLGIAANSATRLYGDANPAFSATYTGFKNGETEAALTGALAFATPAVLTSNVGNYAITPSGRSSTNYTITYVNGRLSVTPAPLGIAANSTSKTYGDTVSFTGSEFSSTGLKNGETIGRVNLDSAGKVATAGVADSPYDITASAASGGTFSAGNYTITYVDGALGVIRAPLGIAANSAARLYGDANPAFSATYTGLKNGEIPAALTGTLALATPGGAASNVGNYAITPSGQSSTNYAISYVNGTLGVTPASLMVSADAKSKVYGTSDPALTFGTTGLVNNDTAATVFSGALARASGETVAGGPYAITRGTLAANSNYTLSSFTGNTLAITPAALHVAANPQSKLFGTSDPALTFSVTGLVNNPALGIADTAGAVLSGALTRASGETVLGGPYAITQGTLAANGNYTLSSFTGNTLAITPLGITGSIMAANKVYDATTAASIVTRTLSGAIVGDDVSYAGGAALFNDKNAGTGKTVTGTGLGLTGADAGNYTVNSTATTTANITPAPLGIAVNSATRRYGDANPAFSATYTGFRGTDSTFSLTGTLALATPAGAASNVGNYAITPSGQSSTNYAISYVNGTLGVTPASLMVSADAKSKVYGTSDPALTFGTTGLVNNDTAATVFSGALARASGETVAGGPYAITRGTLAANSNYTLSSFTGNTLAITPAALHVAANPQSKLFGTSDPALTFSVTGLVNNPALGIADTASTVLSGALTRVPGESALGGPYAITQGSLAANSNYTLSSFTRNNLIITGAAAEPVLGFNAGQVIFAGVINNDFYYRPGNFWHISLNANNADPGFDVMRGTSDLKSRLSRSLNSCDSVSGGGFCETWSFPQQREKVENK